MIIIITMKWITTKQTSDSFLCYLSFVVDSIKECGALQRDFKCWMQFLDKGGVVLPISGTSRSRLLYLIWIAHLNSIQSYKLVVLFPLPLESSTRLTMLDQVTINELWVMTVTFPMSRKWWETAGGFECSDLVNWAQKCNRQRWWGDWGDHLTVNSVYRDWYNPGTVWYSYTFNSTSYYYYLNLSSEGQCKNGIH